MQDLEAVGRPAGGAARAAGARGARAGRGAAAAALLVAAAAGAAAPGCDAGPGDGGGGAGDEAAVRQGEPADLTSPEWRLLSTLNRLAEFGEKRAGTSGGRRAGDYVRERFEQAGLRDVHVEEFTLNGFEVASSWLAFNATGPDGQAQPLPVAGHKVFAYSGVGTLNDVEVVDVGEGRPADYAAPVAGKAVLVRASQSFHRTSQLRVALERGAVAMISSSSAPSNLVQVGGVAPAELGLGPAPALSIGGADGAAVRAAIAAGRVVRATLFVDAAVTPRRGRNVVGRIKRPESQPGDPYLLVGAHYDTWGVGATDNGTGVASLLELARTLDRSSARRYDVVFVGYDAEEVGLFGGYDYLREHVVRGGESIAAFVNLEMTGMAKAEFQGNLLARFFVYSQGGPLDRVAAEADLASVYPNVLGLENVAPLLGGLIPTDAQGLYWYGLDGTIAFGASPFYHTTADTPDTVDVPFLAANTAALKRLLDEIDQEPFASFAPADPTRMYAEVRLDRSNPAVLRVEATVRDAAGQPVPNPWARAQLYVDDFLTPRRADVPPANEAVQELVGDENGKVTFEIASSLANSGNRSRWVHVRVGNASERFPRGEGVTALP